MVPVPTFGKSACRVPRYGYDDVCRVNSAKRNVSNSDRPECIEQQAIRSIRSKLQPQVAIEGKIRRSTWVAGDRETNPGT